MQETKVPLAFYASNKGEWGEKNPDSWAVSSFELIVLPDSFEH